MEGVIILRRGGGRDSLGRACHLIPILCRLLSSESLPSIPSTSLSPSSSLSLSHPLSLYSPFFPPYCPSIPQMYFSPSLSILVSPSLLFSPSHLSLLTPLYLYFVILLSIFLSLSHVSFFSSLLYISPSLILSIPLSPYIYLFHVSLSKFADSAFLMCSFLSSQFC